MILVAEIALIVIAVVLACAWIINPTGNYEPAIVLCTLFPVALEIYRRKAKNPADPAYEIIDSKVGSAVVVETASEDEVKSVFCGSCGSIPGESTSCLGYGRHEFRKEKSPIADFYCMKCGTVPGEYSSCLGYGRHEFVRGEKNFSEIFCLKCGGTPGKYSSCLGYAAHQFGENET